MTPTDRIEKTDNQGIRGGYVNSLILILAILFTLGTLWHSYRVGIDFGAIHARQTNAVLQIEFQLATGHLWFEEVLSGDRKEPIAKAWQHYDKADQYLHVLLKGGRVDDLTYPPLDNPAHLALLDAIDKKIHALREATRIRWDKWESSAAGSEIDQEYDRLFNQIIIQTNTLRSHLMNHMQRNLATYQRTFMLLVPLIALLYLAGGIRLFAAYRKQHLSTVKIQAQERRMEHLYRILNTVRDINQLITREKNPSTLIHKVADNLEGKDGYRETVVALLARDGTVREIARGGSRNTSSDFLNKETVGDILNQFDHIRHDDHKDEIRARLEHAGTVYGIIILGLHAQTGFDREEHDLVGELTDDVAFALHSLSQERQRERAEDLLQRSEADYQALFLNMTSGFALHEMIFDEAGRPSDYRFLVVNPAFERLTTLPAEKLIGRTVREVIPDIEDFWIETYGQVVLTGKPTRFENHSAPLSRHFEVTAFRPAEGQFAVIFDDITPRKEAEDERIRLEEQLRHTQRMEALGNLAGGVAHDFNNLLQGILGHAELMKESGKDNDDILESVQVIGDAGKRAAELTSQLLGFARKGKLQDVPVDLHDLIRETIRLLGRTFDRRIEMELHDNADPAPVIQGDPGQFQQVLMNLAINARDAMPKGGSLVFETASLPEDAPEITRHPELRPGPYIRLTIRDTGEGMSPQDIERVFEPFFTTKQPGHGTGMGLAMAYGIVKNHGGIIEAHSEEGKGSTFHILLPPSKESKTEEPRPPKEKPSRTEATILVVDDEEIIRHLLMTILKSKGCRVLTAEDGLDAVEVFSRKAGEIDLVILDLGMPKMDGMDCFNRLAEIDPNVRVIVSTGHAMNEAVQRMMDRGVLGLLQKPFTRTQIEELVEQTLARKADA